jgi:hypothetical protein
MNKSETIVSKKVTEWVDVRNELALVQRHAEYANRESEMFDRDQMDELIDHIESAWLIINKIC